MIGDMLVDKAFMATIPRRITARMNAIREMSNLGPHGEKVDTTDAIRVMRDLIDVLEWYVAHHDPACRVPRATKSGRLLKFCRSCVKNIPRGCGPTSCPSGSYNRRSACHLEITTREGNGMTSWTRIASEPI